MLYLFDDYTLDTQLYELRHAGVPCPLEPQVLAILLYRLQHRDRLITRQELLEHVWPERFISETTLDHRVMQVRQAIGDSGQAQRRMQTLQWYTAAGQGQRQVVFVTGEVGIGKTTLVDAFVTAIRGHDDIWVGRGQCIEHHGSGEAYRLQGELLLRHAIPDTAQAEACFQKALAIARHQQARSWELRVAMSLARLWQQQGKGAAAYQVLAEVYSWFTEGFETADLQEAKALLAILAGSAGYDLTC